MIDLQKREFRTAIKADADIHGGGNFLWKSYYDKLTFRENGKVELVRITLKENGFDRYNEILMFVGQFNKPNTGHYDVEIDLADVNKKTVIKYCGKLIEPDTLLCHGFVKSQISDSSRYETEIFNEIHN